MHARVHIYLRAARLCIAYRCFRVMIRDTGDRECKRTLSCTTSSSIRGIDSRNRNCRGLRVRAFRVSLFLSDDVSTNSCIASSRKKKKRNVNLRAFRDISHRREKKKKKEKGTDDCVVRSSSCAFLRHMASSVGEQRTLTRSRARTRALLRAFYSLNRVNRAVIGHLRSK